MPGVDVTPAGLDVTITGVGIMDVDAVEEVVVEEVDGVETGRGRAIETRVTRVDTMPGADMSLVDVTLTGVDADAVEEVKVDGVKTGRGRAIEARVTRVDTMPGVDVTPAGLDVTITGVGIMDVDAVEEVVVEEVDGVETGRGRAIETRVTRVDTMPGVDVSLVDMTLTGVDADAVEEVKVDGVETGRGRAIEARVTRVDTMPGVDVTPAGLDVTITGVGIMDVDAVEEVVVEEVDGVETGRGRAIEARVTRVDTMPGVDVTPAGLDVTITGVGIMDVDAVEEVVVEEVDGVETGRGRAIEARVTRVDTMPGVNVTLVDVTLTGVDADAVEEVKVDGVETGRGRAIEARVTRVDTMPGVDVSLVDVTLTGVDADAVKEVKADGVETGRGRAIDARVTRVDTMPGVDVTPAGLDVTITGVGIMDVDAVEEVVVEEVDGVETGRGRAIEARVTRVDTMPGADVSLVDMTLTGVDADAVEEVKVDGVETGRGRAIEARVTRVDTMPGADVSLVDMTLTGVDADAVEEVKVDGVETGRGRAIEARVTRVDTMPGVDVTPAGLDVTITGVGIMDVDAVEEVVVEEVDGVETGRGRAIEARVTRVDTMPGADVSLVDVTLTGVDADAVEEVKVDGVKTGRGRAIEARVTRVDTMPGVDVTPAGLDVTITGVGIMDVDAVEEVVVEEVDGVETGRGRAIDARVTRVDTMPGVDVTPAGLDVTITGVGIMDVDAVEEVVVEEVDGVETGRGRAIEARVTRVDTMPGADVSLVDVTLTGVDADAVEEVKVDGVKTGRGRAIEARVTRVDTMPGVDVTPAGLDVTITGVGIMDVDAVEEVVVEEVDGVETGRGRAIDARVTRVDTMPGVDVTPAGLDVTITGVGIMDVDAVEEVVVEEVDGVETGRGRAIEARVTRVDTMPGADVSLVDVTLTGVDADAVEEVKVDGVETGRGRAIEARVTRVDTMPGVDVTPEDVDVTLTYAVKVVIEEVVG